MSSLLQRLDVPARLASLALLLVVSVAFPGATAGQEPAADVLVDDAPAPAEATPGASERTRDAVASTEATIARTEQVEASLAAMRQVLETDLANEEVGQLLREARRRAPVPEEVRQRVALRERELAQAKVDKVRLLEQRRLSPDPLERSRLSEELDTQTAYGDALEALLAAEHDLLSTSTELVTLLDSHLLWIGSAPPIDASWYGEVVQGVRWFLDPERWLGTVRVLLRRMARRPFQVGLLVLVVGTLFATRRRTRHRLVELGEATNRHSTDRFSLTAAALVLTLLLALPVATLVVGIGWLLAGQNTDAFAAAVGTGLIAAGTALLLVQVFRDVCRKGGLAQVHFQWSDAVRKKLSSNLRWYLLVVLPTAFVGAVCDASVDAVHRRGLGRLAFLVGSVALTIFAARVFSPSRGLFASSLARDGLAYRTRRLWYGALVLLPALLTFAAGAGYYFTATEILRRFFLTGALVLTGTIVYSLLTRWLLVTRRRLAIQQARQRLAEQRQARRAKGQAEASPVASGDAVPDLDEGELDVESASEQTLSLLRTVVGFGVLATLWLLWARLLPALAEMGDVELAGATLDIEGNVIVPAVTLWSLLLAAVALILTFVVARNLPAVLDLAVLERFAVTSGSRYAIVTLTRYLTVTVGVIVSSDLLGIEWGRAQWILAALGVGLGFGLQEIVANFVSGLIILLERPVRVGDVVTVDGVSGTVSRLQIRATTITDWDNKEVLVPNKNFITGQVVNWTLSNAVTRLLIPVGVAYGSDVAAAHRAITDAVLAVDAVLETPAPSVFFVGFGESSLDFEVRAFVDTLPQRLPTLHALHASIEAALGAAGIEIPFPQRDLHLRSSDVGSFGIPASGATATESAEG